MKKRCSEVFLLAWGMIQWLPVPDPRLSILSEAFPRSGKPANGKAAFGDFAVKTGSASAVLDVSDTLLLLHFLVLSCPRGTHQEALHRTQFIDNVQPETASPDYRPRARGVQFLQFVAHAQDGVVLRPSVTHVSV